MNAPTPREPTTVDEAREALRRWHAQFGINNDGELLALEDALIAAVRAEDETAYDDKVRQFAQAERDIRADSAQELVALREAAEDVLAELDIIRTHREAADDAGWLLVHINTHNALRAALAATPAETFWLIERGQPAEWYGSYATGRNPWTSDVHKAVRFGSRAEAEAFITRHVPDARATEHSLLGPRPATAWTGDPADYDGDEGR